MLSSSLDSRECNVISTAQEARQAESGSQRLWDERTGRCLADFANNIKGDSLVIEMGVEEGRRMTTSELIMLVQVF